MIVTPVLAKSAASRVATAMPRARAMAAIWASIVAMARCPLVEAALQIVVEVWNGQTTHGVTRKISSTIPEIVLLACAFSDRCNSNV
jgi:hypothetical protein